MRWNIEQILELADFVANFNLKVLDSICPKFFNFLILNIALILLVSIQAQATEGQLPNVEVLGDLGFHYEEIDYLQVGYAIGEIGILTGRPCASLITCETHVTVYHISQLRMKEAMKRFNDEEEDSLESRMWRSVGMRVAAALLPVESQYQSWTLDKIRVHVEQSAVPIGPKFEEMSIPEFICDVILLEGKIQDGNTKEVFTAPLTLPRSCKKLAKV